MAWHLLGAKPLSKPMISYHGFDHMNQYQAIILSESMLSLTNILLKISLHVIAIVVLTTIT